ncbi:MAG: ribose-5-phosphate isomerase RpiA [Planctomycetia bacterium]
MTGRRAAEAALEMVRPGTVVGLGSGRAATVFVEALGERVRAGFDVAGVPTSLATAAVARKAGIPLKTLDEVESLDLAVDGADEVAPDGGLIKGYGGALVRERVVAAAAKRFVVLVGEEKRVAALGARGRLPVEVLPFAVGFVARRLRPLGLTPTVRLNDQGEPFVTDNGNTILDCALAPPIDPAALDAAIRALPGVVGTGFFLNMADVVFIETLAGLDRWDKS